MPPGNCRATKIVGLCDICMKLHDFPTGESIRHVFCVSPSPRAQRAQSWISQGVMENLNLVARRIRMNATSSPQVLEKIKVEHDALRNKLGRIHACLVGPQIAAEDIVKLLREFRGALAVHFSNEEESEGFFASVTAHAPRLAHQAGRLCVEHEALLRKADELCRFASAGSPSMTWWRELSTRCQEFSRQLMHHESEENNLLQRAYLEDLGGIGD
jgi:hypothetical protein